MIMRHAAPNLAWPMTDRKWHTPPRLRAQAGIVIDAATGETLFAKAADRRLYPASMTKIVRGGDVRLRAEAVEGAGGNRFPGNRRYQ